MTYFWLSFVLPTEITKDCRVLRIGGHNFSATVNWAMRLVEIYRLEPTIVIRMTISGTETTHNPWRGGIHHEKKNKRVRQRFFSARAMP